MEKKDSLRQSAIDTKAELNLLKTATKNKRKLDHACLSYIKRALAILYLLNPTTQQKEYLDAIGNSTDQILNRR